MVATRMLVWSFVAYKWRSRVKFRASGGSGPDRSCYETWSRRGHVPNAWHAGKVRKLLLINLAHTRDAHTQRHIWMVCIWLRKPLQGTAARSRLAFIVQKADWNPLQQVVPTLPPSHYLSMILIARTLLRKMRRILQDSLPFSDVRG